MSALGNDVEPTVETDTLAPLAMRELVEALVGELTEWAFAREKVLEKLDLRAARRARALVLELRGFMRAALEGRVDEHRIATILDGCHQLLSGTVSRDSDAPLPASVVSAVRRITQRMPAIVPMYGEDEPTLPGERRSLVSLTSLDAEDDNDKTAAGLPDDVLAKYLREVRRAAV
ncbi:MAG: hypothetical protein U0414_11865 [Polyangiaceae bacterium]